MTDNIDNTATKETQRKNRGRGCLIACLVIIALAANTFWQVRVPGRHARHMRNAIQNGMSLDQLETLLNSSNDRHFIRFQVLAAGKWETVSRDQFVQTVGAPADSATVHARVQLTFMGMAPNRVSFFVEFDNAGHVSQITTPRGWD